MKINNVALHCGPDALPRHARHLAESVAEKLAADHPTILLHLDRSLPCATSGTSVVEFLLGSFQSEDAGFLESIITSHPEDGYEVIALGQYPKDLEDLEDILFSRHTRGDRYLWQDGFSKLIIALAQHYAPHTSVLSLVWCVGSSLTDPFSRAILDFGERHQVPPSGGCQNPHSEENDVRWMTCALGADGPWAEEVLGDYTNIQHATSSDTSRIVSQILKEESKVVKVEMLTLEGRKRHLASPLFLKVQYTGSWHCTLDLGEYVLFAEGDGPDEVAEKLVGLLPQAWDRYVLSDVSNLPTGGFAVRSKLREMLREV